MKVHQPGEVIVSANFSDKANKVVVSIGAFTVIVLGGFFLVGMIFIVTTGKTPGAYMRQKSDNQEAVDKIEYRQAKNGLCFGVSRLGIFHISCDVVRDQVKRD